jgi:uncharacterized protein with beta-barrel porin domain
LRSDIAAAIEVYVISKSGFGIGYHRQHRRFLLTGTALPVVALLVAWTLTTSAFADGGSGGSGATGAGTGGSGGADNLTGATGGAGTAGTANAGGGGGGGGGAGGAEIGGPHNAGGAGGAGSGGATGGLGATALNVAGGNGAPGANPGDGGGGGGGALNDTIIGSGSTSTGNFTAAAGGFGGAGNGSGGGGAGGAGAAQVGYTATATDNSSASNLQLIGGAGGAGGASATGSGGAGGTGGAGSFFLAGGTEIVGTGTLLSGGNGGAGGSGGAGNGANGAGGVGVVGENLAVVNAGTIRGGLNGDGVTRANAIEFTGGANTLTLSGGWQLIGGIALDTTSTSLSFNQSTTQTVANLITGSGSVIQNGTGTLVLSGANTYSGITTVDNGTLSLAHATAGVIDAASTSFVDLNGGALRFAVSGTFGNAINFTANTGTISATTATTATLTGEFLPGPSNVHAVFGSATDTGTIVFAASSLPGSQLATLEVAGGTLQAGAGNTSLGTSTAGAGTTQIDTGGTLDFNGNNATIANLQGTGGTLTNASGATTTIDAGTFRGVIAGAGAVTIAGNTTLSGTNTYTGATTVNVGVLNVTGSIATSALTTVNANAALTGTGAVGATQINAGGVFAPGSGTPGTSMTVASLAFASGAFYAVSINPTTASFANVNGAANLGGATVSATFANGSYISKQYTILTAASLGGTTFNATVANTNLPSNFHDTLSYDATHAYLNLTLNFAAPNFGNGLSGNQNAVGNTLINFFNTSGSIPMAFGALTPAGLTQVSGETATGSQQTTFDAMGQFMGLLTDPFMNRSGGAGAPSSSSGYAATSNPTDAFAMFTKAPPQTFEQRWSVWAAGYGGSQSTSGNTVVGSNNTTSNVAGTAVGADYLISPNTIAGFALAGGGTSFSVANGGTGRSDLFQAGAYVRHNEGPAYISAALAYGWQDITTNRTVTAAGLDHLRAEFNANAWSGRVEGGYRFATYGVGITPYAAAQFVTFDLPAYAEQAIAGANTLALAYGAKDVTDARSELGIRTDKSWLVSDGIFTVRARFAWAHDYDPNRSIAATFQTLPGASFVVNGAAQAADSALVTASIEKKWRNGWSAAATFEGEFSNVTSSYAGKGVVRYAW